MATEVLLRGQRWEFEHGNHRLVMENAVYLADMFSQERIVVDGEVVRDRQSEGEVLWRWTKMFETTWLTADGEQTVALEWRSGLMTIHARVLLDGVKQPWTDYFKAKWYGEKGAWPPGPDGF